MSLGRLLVVDDDRSFAAELTADGERLGLDVRMVHETSAFESILQSWTPNIIAMDLVMPDSDGLELIRICGRLKYTGALILMSGGFELYLKMAEEIARTNDLNVAAKLPKPFRPKQFSYLLMSLIQRAWPTPLNWERTLMQRTDAHQSIKAMCRHAFLRPIESDHRADADLLGPR